MTASVKALAADATGGVVAAGIEASHATGTVPRAIALRSNRLHRSLFRRSR